MPDQFLEVDEVLQALTDELSRFKSSTEQLSLSRKSASDLIDSIRKQSELTAELARRSSIQLEAMTMLTQVTEASVGQLTQQQRELAATIEERFEHIQSALAEQQTTLALITGKLEDNETRIHEIDKMLNDEIIPGIEEVEDRVISDRHLIWSILLLMLANFVVCGFILILTG